MNAVKQNIADARILLRTDRRIWAAAGFLAFVLFIWTATGTWREVEEVEQEQLVRIRAEEIKINDFIKDFNHDLREGEEERRYLRESVQRFAHELQVGQDEMDWHMNVLVNKLSDMTERIDGIANEVGASAVNKAQFEDKLSRQKANRKRKVAVDRSAP